MERLAGFLAQAQIRIERVIHSGKLRARQTTERLAQSIAKGVELETSDLISPNDNPQAFDSQIDGWGRDTLIVGHLPFMAKLVAHLLIGNEAHAITAFQPGSIVCLERVDDAHWQLDWMLRPELLR